MSSRTVTDALAERDVLRLRYSMLKVSAEMRRLVGRNRRSGGSSGPPGPSWSTCVHSTCRICASRPLMSHGERRELDARGPGGELDYRTEEGVEFIDRTLWSW